LSPSYGGFSASRLLPEAGLDVVWQQFYQREGLSQEKQKNKKIIHYQSLNT